MWEQDMTEAYPNDNTPTPHRALKTLCAASGEGCAMRRSADAELIALAAELRRAEADHDAAMLHLDAAEGTQADGAASAAVDAVFAAWDALTRRMAAIPAEGAPGLAAKAARLVVAVRCGHTAADAALAASVARDAVRLAPGAVA
jgi:hypothetical protein